MTPPADRLARLRELATWINDAGNTISPEWAARAIEYRTLLLSRAPALFAALDAAVVLVTAVDGVMGYLPRGTPGCACCASTRQTSERLAEAARVCHAALGAL